MNCTRCQGTGFLNLHQVPNQVLEEFEKTGEHGVILDWIEEMKRGRERLGCSCHISPPCPGCDYLHDVQVCDCCGNGEDWHGEPGNHNHFQGPNATEPFPGCY
jgi:hypothetical protein